ncbi:MAG: hypothetical protein GX555_01680 [Actinomycetales bacterium]|nr:hypothetical protein [Actinomycetales bacterium]
MNKTPRTLTVALALTLSVGLAACGSEAEPETSTPDTTASAEDTAPADDTASDAPTTDDAAATSDDAAATTDDAAGTAAGDLTALGLAAIDTAIAETDGVAYEIDDLDDDGTWEVDVRVGDRSVEVKVTADGTEVVATEDDDLDEDDRAALDIATITLSDAITLAVDEVGGVLDDAELETDDGTAYWEVTVDTDAKDDIEVKVSLDGEILEIDN